MNLSINMRQFDIKKNPSTAIDAGFSIPFLPQALTDMDVLNLTHKVMDPEFGYETLK